MLSSFNNDLNAEMKTAGVPFSPFPLRFGTAQRELSRMTQKIVLPAQRICSPVNPGECSEVLIPVWIQLRVTVSRFRWLGIYSPITCYHPSSFECKSGTQRWVPCEFRFWGDFALLRVNIYAGQSPCRVHERLNIDYWVGVIATFSKMAAYI